MEQVKHKLKLGDLVTVEAIATVTNIESDGMRLGYARLTFDNGSDVYLPVDYLCPVPTSSPSGYSIN